MAKDNDKRSRRQPTAEIGGWKHSASPEVDDLEALVKSEDVAGLRSFLAVLHPADFADLFKILPRDNWARVVGELNIRQTACLMEELPDDLRDDLAEYLAHEQLTQVIEQLASDDAADVLADLPEELAKDVIEALPEEDRHDVEVLLRYRDDTAGGLMQMELLSVSEHATVDETIQAVRRNYQEVGNFHYIYVIDEEDKLAGALRKEQLLLAPPDQPVRDLMVTDLQVVAPQMDQEEVARMFERYDLVALPVIDESGRLLGRILHDDAVDVLEEEAAEDMLRMAGASPDEPELVYTDRVFKIASVRLPWLLATLVGLTIPAILISAFQVSFPHMLTLVPFIPVVGAMGGNVGTQSATIVVRGFACGRVDYHNLGQLLLKELVISATMGVACSITAGVVAFVWHRNYMLCAVVMAAMMVAVVVSAVMGILVPYLFRWLRFDPAIAAGPAVTTIDDMIAISIYYLFALLLIR